MARIRTIVAQCQDNLTMIINQVSVKVEAGMVTMEITMEVALLQATIMLIITLLLKLPSLVHICSTQGTSKISTEDKNKFKVRIREWTSQGLIIQETCLNLTRWTNNLAKCYHQLQHQVAAKAQTTLDRWFNKTKCTVLVDKTIGSCRKIDKRQSDRVCWAVEMGRVKCTLSNRLIAMTELKLNYSNLMKLLQPIRYQYKLNQCAKDPRQLA